MLMIALVHAEDFSVPEYSLSGMPAEVAADLKVRIEEITVIGQLSDLGQQAQNYGQLGRLFMAYDLASQAELCFLKASQLEPGEANWSYLRALLAQQRGDSQAALGLLGNTLAARPNYVPAIAHLARLYRELGEFDSADRVIHNLPPGDAATPAILASWAEHWLETGRPEQAIEPLTTALAAEPRANRLHYLLGTAYRSIGQIPEAKTHLGQAGEVGLALDDPYLQAVTDLAQTELFLIQRGNKAYEAGDYESAVVAFAEAVNKSPGSVRARINLAAALAEKGNVEAALSQLDQVLVAEPANGTALYNAARLNAQTGQLIKSDQQFSRLLANEPADYQSWLDHAAVLKALGNSEHALRAAIMAQTEPTLFVPATLLEVELRLQQRQYGKAIASLRGARQRLPDDLRFMITLANIHATAPPPNRDPEAAMALAMAAHERSPSTMTAEAVALAFAAANQCDKSAEWLGRAAELAMIDPESARLKQMEKFMGAVVSCKPK